MKLNRFLAVVCLTAACNVADDSPVVAPLNNTANNTTNNASNNTTNNTANNASNNNTNGCAACTDAEVCFEQACCTPATECALDQCGMVTDGCGGTIDCGTCGCTDDNFAEFCPTRPCEVATACDENRECVYEAVTCGGSACVCAGETCTDTEIRDCRDPNALVCPADFCDPSPSMVNGAVVYANTCIEPDGANCDFSNLCAQGNCAGATCAEAPCGLCNLGFWECAPMTTDATCYDVPLSAADLASTNCNDNSANSTFIFLDHVDGVDAAGSGSRAQPYKSFDAAVAAAKQRGAKGVIARSGLTLSSTLVLENGISLYGGFSGAPNWKYDGGTLNVAVSSTNATGNVVAVVAHDITERTVLYRVNIQSGKAIAQKSSSYGIHALNAPGLVLEQVNILASNGAPGLNGRAGSAGANGKNGGDGNNNRAAGGGGTNPFCPIANGADGGIGAFAGNNGGADGADTTRGVFGGTGGGPGEAGSSGRSAIVLLIPGTGGAGGLHAYDLLTNFYVPTGDGEKGIDGVDGYGGSGGGGSGGVKISLPFGGDINAPGAGGGGGAAGGCGGNAGSPGLAGGGSFGVFAVSSTGLQIIDSNIKSGDAGDGGTGGAGGNAGSPGSFGDGGTAAQTGKRGGNGGKGTSGSDGGAGGGGAGGDTYAVFCEDTTITNTNSSLGSGAAGAGGISTGSDGENGTAGDSLNCE